jgi:hypothetical protein
MPSFGSTISLPDRANLSPFGPDARITFAVTAIHPGASTTARPNRGTTDVLHLLT